MNCKICLRKSNAEICYECIYYCNMMLTCGADMSTLIYKCILCKKIKTIDKIFVMKSSLDFICKSCYKIYYNHKIKRDNTCMLCLEYDLLSIDEHLRFIHNKNLKCNHCNYCDKKDFSYKDYTKDYYIKHYCNIPIKNKYMNVNIL